MYPSTIVAALDGLERRGVAERQVDTADRRRRLVHLTAEGRKTLRRAEGLARGVTAEMLAPLDEAEQAALNALLRKLTGLGAGPSA